MKKIFNIVRSVCLLFLIAGTLYAQKVGSTSMQFLHVMPSARATALGDAYTVWASGAEAVFWNPSGVALTRGQEISSTYIDWLFDTRQGAFSYALSLDDIGGLGMQIQYVDYGEFEETSLDRPYINNPSGPGFTGRSFHPFSVLAGLSYGKNLTDRFAVGVGVKYAHESLFDGQRIATMVSSGVYSDVKTWADILLFDFGIRYNTGYRSIQVGASVQNFGANAEYAVQSNPVPLLFRVGAAAELVGSDALVVSGEEQNKVRLEFDLFQPNDYTQQQHAGVEYEFDGVFALRAGYKFNYDNEGLTLGAGINHTLGAVGLSFDYSYGSMGTYLGNIQRISLGAKLQ
ncbi:MAG: PorV/PorQ family protein [Bacteroidetes bacterium]|nr:MAG: PorV/PorQ family protein [Bacteroidota bacterium]